MSESHNLIHLRAYTHAHPYARSLADSTCSAKMVYSLMWSSFIYLIQLWAKETFLISYSIYNKIYKFFFAGSFYMAFSHICLHTCFIFFFLARVRLLFFTYAYTIDQNYICIWKIRVLKCFRSPFIESLIGPKRLSCSVRCLPFIASVNHVSNAFKRNSTLHCSDCLPSMFIFANHRH